MRVRHRTHRVNEGTSRRKGGVGCRSEAAALEPRILLSGATVFNDEFNLPVGAQPATSTWQYRNGTDPNNSNVRYTNTPATLHVVSDAGAEDGKALAMTLSQDPTAPGKFLSSEIQTNVDPVAGQLQYGHIEARIKLPGGPNGQGQGIWPAYWMLGSNYPQVGWPACGEIDIMENKGSTPGQVQGTIHGPGYSGGAGITAHYTLAGGQSFYSDYHTFAVDWAPNWIAFSVDGHVYATRTPANLPVGKTWVYNHPFYIILDVAEGGAFAGPAGANSVYPQTMLVDHVRAYAYHPAVSGALPGGWSDGDIGAPGVAGTAGFDGATFTVAGGGQDVWNTSDQFNFASRTFTGDVTIVARAESLTDTGNYAKAGVMIRDGTSATASYAFMFVEPANGAQFEGATFEYRPAAGAASQASGSGSGITAPEWVKLVRSGNTFTGFYSPDDKTWTQAGPSQTIPMSQTVNVGLAVDANNDAAVNTATFSNVQVGVSVTDPFLAAAGHDIRNGHGSGDVVQLRGVNLGGWLVHESWMDPMDSSGLPDDYSVRQTLDSRFGVAARNQILSAYQNNWITPQDLDNIRAMGMNVIRVPFWYRNVEEEDGTWRSDAFTRLDWVVSEAWKRGIYTVLDLHGAVGGQSGADHTGRVQTGGGQYWSSTTDQSRTADLWARVAAHFRGNPAVAGYDLLNEPTGAPAASDLWNGYNSLYTAVRGADPDHIVMMEGTWRGTINGTFVNWDWNVLPAPTTFGWANVVYEMHAYAGGSTLADEQAEVNKQVSGYLSHQSYDVPVFIGEFNNHADPNAWAYAIQQYDQNHMSWADWAYKATNGTAPNPWGLYDPTGSPLKPNLQTDSLTTILNDYAQISTAQRFAINPLVEHALAMPLPVDDAFHAAPGQMLSVSAASGVLANDTDLNRGQSGIQLAARLVTAPVHGRVSLNADGSFTYTPGAGFTGTDAFRYSDVDGHSDSTRIATVTIVVDAPPKVIAARFNYTATQPTVSFTFDQDVSMSLSAAALQVQNLNGGTSPTWSAPTYDPATNTATFTFASPLSDGNYRATLTGALVADAAGSRLAQDSSFDFFVLRGDVNHDGTVDFSDLLLLAQHYGQPGTFAAGDLTHDGTVDFNDLLLLAQSYGHSLPALLAALATHSR